ncbi:MAG: helix-turn-helix transcriptional regulator, partial [bacterium]|nr:helix-turn-helix transcriptional regulator [bacterium]
MREARNLSQAALAAKIRESTGVRATASRISRWEGGEEMPSVRSLFALLEGMQADVHDLADALEVIGGGEPLVDEYLEASGKLLAAS